MSKEYRLIVGHDFSLANETDANPQSDYFPGIWAIGTQKRALAHAQKIIAEGNTVTVTDYENPKYHALSNYFIKALGLNQELFPEPKKLEAGIVTNDKPKNLAQFKKFLTVGKKVRMLGCLYAGIFKESRETEVLSAHADAFTTDYNGKRSWCTFGKAGDWVFDNGGATNYMMQRDGEMVPVIRVEYIA